MLQGQADAHGYDNPIPILHHGLPGLPYAINMSQILNISQELHYECGFRAMSSEGYVVKLKHAHQQLLKTLAMTYSGKMAKMRAITFFMHNVPLTQSSDLWLDEKATRDHVARSLCK